jgi:hypothetical protein
MRVSDNEFVARFAPRRGKHQFVDIRGLLFAEISYDFFEDQLGRLFFELFVLLESEGLEGWGDGEEEEQQCEKWYAMFHLVEIIIMVIIK